MKMFFLERSLDDISFHRRIAVIRRMQTFPLVEEIGFELRGGGGGVIMREMSYSALLSRHYSTI